MARHVVLSGPIEHDGARYEDGDELTISGDAAAALVAEGILQVLHSAVKSSKPTEARH